MGTANQNPYPMATGAVMAGQANSKPASIEHGDEIWSTKEKFRNHIWLTIGIFLVPIVIGMSWFLVHRAIKADTQPARATSESRIDSTIVPVTPETKLGKIVEGKNGSKVVFQKTYEDLTLAEIPENMKTKSTVMFVKDGSATIFTNLKNDGQGLDTIWRSNGKWYAILTNRNITRDDYRMVSYSSIESCGDGCMPVTILDK